MNMTLHFQFGRTFLMAADFMMGSPTALADAALESEVSDEIHVLI